MAQQYSYMLLVLNQQHQFTVLKQLLQHYFPYHNQQQNQSSQNLNLLTIQNKYYKANIKLQIVLWKHIKHQTLSQIYHKIDLMLMYIEQNQHQPNQIISKFNPEQFALLFHTEQPDNTFSFQQIILEKCDNFIQIIKENVYKISQEKPHWNKNTLLNAQYNEQYAFFSILDRMETTTWSNLANNKQKVKSKGEREQQKMHQQTKQNEQVKVNEVKEQKGSVQNEQQDVEMQEEDLQSEMVQFQSMMNEMMGLKMMANNLSDNDRKAKAESIFKKLTKNIQYD